MPRKNQPPTNSNPNCKPKKKKGHHPTHQNKFAYRHNPKSKLTDKILSSPNVGLCRRCHDKVEWRKRYRKYKPLTQPSTCNLCMRRNITAAYHTICDDCALGDVAYEKMMAVIVTEQGVGGEGAGVGQGEGAATAGVGTTSNDTNNDGGHARLTHEDNTTPSTTTNTSTTTTTRICNKVCAMCVKEPAKADDSDKTDIQTQIDEQINAMEAKLKRPLKLRETKAIERKAQRAHEKEKERLREERRRAREAEEEEIKRKQEEEEEEVVKAKSDRDLVENSNINKKFYDDSDEEEDDDNDPFLTAIGGRSKLLTGDAYQNMMLEKEKRLSKIQISN